MLAMISDIHSNREALDAVFQVIDRLDGLEEIICLGDVIGYGAEPEYCVDVIRKRCSVCLMGNHDLALFRGAHDFNPIARGAIDFTLKRMRPRGFLAPSAKRSRWKFLRNLPEEYRLGDYAFFHASPRDPIREYVLATDGLVKPEKMESIYQNFERLAFVGHTHQPGLHGPAPHYRFFGLTGNERTSFHVPPGVHALINVGSVGQPRDGDPRSCFATVEEAPEDGDLLKDHGVDHDFGGGVSERGHIVTWYRVKYDYESTMRKIRAEGGLHEMLARRLAVGK